MIAVRSATEADLEEVSDMVRGFVAGHPAESRPRPLAHLREAFFGSSPVAQLVVASRDGRIVGMGQWTRIYDMFWSIFGGEVGWLYVRPEARGLGIPAALVAEIARQVRLDGGEMLHGGSEADIVTRLYERVAIASPGRSCYVSGEAFHAFADLAAQSPRAIVRHLPAPALNGERPRPRPNSR
jgi:GNAT superfamily N-acetyltransferase